MKKYIQPQAIVCDVLLEDIMVVSVDKGKADEGLPVQVPENRSDENRGWDKSPLELEQEGYWE